MMIKQSTSQPLIKQATLREAPAGTDARSDHAVLDFFFRSLSRALLFSIASMNASHFFCIKTKERTTLNWKQINYSKH
jgi:hypothetical protein